MPRHDRSNLSGAEPRNRRTHARAELRRARRAVRHARRATLRAA